MKINSALSIAGSDPSSGAGIQADIKTFSSLGVYGCSAITAITVQNTQEIIEIFPIPSKIVIKQIKLILEDIKIDSIKIGMVYDESIIIGIYDILKNENIPIIIDPIFTSTSGRNLIKPEAMQVFTKKLLTIATITTPNIKEAIKLSGIKINTKEDIKKALQNIKDLGPKNVIIKGARETERVEVGLGEHYCSKESIDTLIENNLNIREFSNPLLRIPENHGSGCNFSAALSAFISQGYEIPRACYMANEFVNKALQNLLDIGKGNPIVDTSINTSLSSFKFQVIEELAKAIKELEEIKGMGKLIPETQSNFVYAIPNANNITEVAGVKGRIVKIDEKEVKASSSIEFGASKHIASAVISYMTINPTIRAGFNLKYDKKIIELLQSFLKISEYERQLEPSEFKEKEGYTISWGIKEALRREPNANVIYHKGDIGKEPMIIVFGQNPKEVITYLKRILEKY
ncbi:MAG TPA: bifunctional hydroxymethylpyrimidine kinase/phosphomethylpyrimidine kinase [Nitrososphaeraceae archaeon]|nr:bifunctional hydroxymethylpyrimidine kinase/phosphomethylpyrimidine kinase [Nitrososphaeraceae archaeon]